LHKATGNFTADDKSLLHLVKICSSLFSLLSNTNLCEQQVLLGV